MAAVALDPLEHGQRLLRRLAVDAVEDQFGVADDGIERGAQLVAHVGEELRLVLARLGKLSARLLDLVEQPHILDGDHSLVGEGGQQLDLLFGERFHDLALQGDYADWRAFAQQWNAQHRANAADPRRFGHFVVRFGQHISDMNGATFHDRAPDNRTPSRRQRVGFDKSLQFGRKAVGGT